MHFPQEQLHLLMKEKWLKWNLPHCCTEQNVIFYKLGSATCIDVSLFSPRENSFFYPTGNWMALTRVMHDVGIKNKTRKSLFPSGNLMDHLEKMIVQKGNCYVDYCSKVNFRNHELNLGQTLSTQNLLCICELDSATFWLYWTNLTPSQVEKRLWDNTGKNLHMRSGC